MKIIRKQNTLTPPLWFTTYMAEFRKDFKAEIIDEIRKEIKSAIEDLAAKNNLKT